MIEYSDNIELAKKIMGNTAYYVNGQISNLEFRYSRYSYNDDAIEDAIAVLREAVDLIESWEIGLYKIQ